MIFHKEKVEGTDNLYSCTFSVPEGATSGYYDFLQLTSKKMSETELKELISKANFPKATDKTAELPLEQRRWLFVEAFPIVASACGATNVNVWNEPNPAD